MPSERRFELPGLALAARVWGRVGELPVLAAHGWLDNAGTFDLLAPQLGGCQLVALDLAGHGLSDSRSPDASYNIWQDAGDFLEVAEQLGWQRFNLLGHSRGAAIAMLFAAAFPERVDKLVLIEGGVPMPLTTDVAEAPATLARALLDRRNLQHKSGRVFASRDAAIEERAQGFSKVSRAAAEILARRSLREVNGGFRWHADQRLKGSSEVRLTPEQIRAFLRRVVAPALMVLAEESPFSHSRPYLDLVAELAALEVVRLPGGHHLHLESAAAEVAARVRRFLGLPGLA